MLSVPFKKTDASIDLAGPLRRYLMKEFSKVQYNSSSAVLCCCMLGSVDQVQEGGCRRDAASSMIVPFSSHASAMSYHVTLRILQTTTVQ